MVRILLSEESARMLAQPIRERLAGRAHTLVVVDAQAPVPADIDIAFLSRDIAGSSAKQALSPNLLAFYAALRASERLQWLQIFSAGADRAVYQDMRARGVLVTSATGAACAEVSHSAVAGMLALTRRLPLLLKAQERREWVSLHRVGLPAALSGQHALVVGLGPIGRNIARILQAFDMQVTGVRRRFAETPECGRTVTYEDIDTVLPTADWLFLACPLTDTTRRLLDPRRIALLKRGVGIVNVARGEVVDETGLIAALRSGQVGSAFLDVFEEEPLPAASPLWALDNVIVTPHCASHSDHNVAQIQALFLENLVRWRQGGAMLNRTG